jgi:hypothetical protein
MNRFAAAVGILSVSLGGVLCAQEMLQRTFANENSHMYGWSVSDIGDLNRDGYSDAIVGGWLKRDGEPSGQVVVVSGMDGSALFTFTSGTPVGRFGWSVANAGDVDADGRNDILVGSPLFGIGVKTEAGRIDVFSGRDGTRLFKMIGVHAGDQFGWDVDSVGDLDLDGHADFAVGSPGFESGRGRVQVFSGADQTVMLQKLGTAGSALGRAVAGLGDVDKDGIPDLIVGAPLDHSGGVEAGRAVVICGANGAVLHRITGDSFGDRLGSAVSRAGDIDHDGFADFMIGVPFDDAKETNTGSVLVYSGADARLLVKVWGDRANDQFGSAVSAARDFNADGHLDFIVGAPFSDANGDDSGLARVFSGRTFASLYTFVGNSAGDQFGFSVSLVGDQNSDGYFDVIVGAPFDVSIPGSEQEFADPGQAFVFGGHGLFLETDNHQPREGQILTLTTLEGELAMPTMMVVVEIAGVPVSLPIGGLGFLDATGARTLAATVPPGLSGLEIEVMALALNSAGRVDSTLPRSILFR